MTIDEAALPIDPGARAWFEPPGRRRGRRGADRRRRLRAADRGPAPHARPPGRRPPPWRRRVDAHRRVHRGSRRSSCARATARQSTPTAAAGIPPFPMIHLTKALVRRWLDTLLHVADTPERTAAAFAMGVFFGFSPFLGFHTVLAIVFAFFLDLNRVAVLLGVYSNLPWIIGPYYALVTMVGGRSDRARAAARRFPGSISVAVRAIAVSRRILAPPDHNSEAAALAVHRGVDAVCPGARRRRLSGRVGVRDKPTPDS